MSEQASASAATNVFRCRYCSWNCAKWMTLKNGQRRSGWARLETHLEDAHGILTVLTDSEARDE